MNGTFPLLTCTAVLLGVGAAFLFGVVKPEHEFSVGLITGYAIATINAIRFMRRT